MTSLRKALQVMVDTQDSVGQVAELRKLRRQFAHTIRILPSPHQIRRYTCLMHALAFSEKPEYIQYALRDIYAGVEFAHWIIDHNYLMRLPKDEVRRGSIVMYFNTGEFKHAGLVNAPGRITSKWGTFHLLSHGLLEVPSSYGRKIRYFVRPTYAEAFAHLVEYGREKGVVLDEAGN